MASFHPLSSQPTAILSYDTGVEHQAHIISLINANNIEQLTSFINKHPNLTFTFNAQKQPLVTYLINTQKYDALLCISKHCICKNLDFKSTLMPAVMLLKTLFSPTDENNSEKLKLLEYLVENIPLTYQDKMNCPIIQFGLKTEWDDALSLRSVIFARLKKEGVLWQCRVNGEPLLMYLASHPEYYSEATIESLVNFDVASELPKLEDLEGIKPSIPPQETNQHFHLNWSKRRRSSSLSELSSFSSSANSETKSKLKKEKTVPLKLDPAPISYRKKVSKSTEYLSKKTLHPTSPFLKFERKIKSGFTHFEQWSKHSFSKLTSRIHHAHRPEDELSLIHNRAFIGSDVYAKSSEEDYVIPPLSPLHVLSDKEKKVTIQKLQLYREHIKRLKDIEAKAQAALSQRDSLRQKVRVTRQQSLKMTPTPISKAQSFTFSESSRKTGEWVTFEEAPTSPGIMSPAEKSESVMRWKSVFTQIKSKRLVNSIPTENSSTKPSLWSPTLLLVEQKLIEQHHESEAASKAELSNVTKGLKKSLASIKATSDSTSSQFTDVVDSLVNQLDSYGIDEGVELYSKAIFHSAALVTQFAMAKEVFKKWDASTIGHATRSLSELTSVVLNTTSAVSDGIGNLLPAHMQQMASTISESASAIDRIQSCLQEIQHVTLEIVQLVKQFTKSDDKVALSGIAKSCDLLTLIAELSKSLFSILQKVLFAAKDILEITGKASIGLNKAIPGLGIVISIIDIVQRSLYLGNNAYYMAQLSEMKVRDQEYFPDHAILSFILDEEQRTNYYTLNDIAYDGKIFVNLSPEVIREAKRYSMVCELKKVCRKRVISASYKIFFDLASVTGDILKLGGVTSEVGAGLSLGIALSKASIITINWLKQSYHNHQEDLHSNEEKHVLRCRLIESLFQFFVAFAEQDITDDDKFESYIEQYGELRVFFYSFGLKTSDFLGKKVDEEGVKKVYKALKRRE
ncbi:methyl-accepting chemotaxis protein [Parashewanella spongiae]|uniref:Methyl-accepting chemotaxis protein n=2 Tax=Parashewanella spongiae TaxID=342950 RepID=A0A3A6TTW3_9GAMM|nr:methyl-accepting chemotaxis protein [Parashewanella spongiae]